MSIAVACECGKQLRVKDEYAGKRAKCPGCGNFVGIPTNRIESESESEGDFPVAAQAHKQKAGSSQLSQDDLVWKEGMPNSKKSSSIPGHVDEDAADDDARSPTAVKGRSTLISPSRSTGANEPWYYGFLESYARIGRVFGIALALLLFAPFALYYLVALLGGIAFGVSLSNSIIAIVLLTLALIFIGLVLLGIVLVPILISVALIHVFVDVGRNLRAIRKSLSHER